MGQVVSEGLEYIGRIDDAGYIFDQSGSCIAKIDDAGYISKVGGYGTYGKIDADGTIRDSSSNVVGRIQADGYVYIHSKRVCKVSSAFVERITPKAWNVGQTSTYSGRAKKSTYEERERSGSESLKFLPFIIKLIIGIILGIAVMVTGGGGIGMLLAGPIVVFLLSLIYKAFNH